jgi:hypothetical protein
MRRYSLGVVVALSFAAYGQNEPPAESTDDVVRYYVCQTKQVLELTDAGDLEETNYAKAIGMHQGRFAVDRRTGITMAGPFATADAKGGQVLSEGNDENPFVVVSLGNAPYVHLKALQVESYANGADKPFLGLSGNLVITGTCQAGESQAAQSDPQSQTGD